MRSAQALPGDRRSSQKMKSRRPVDGVHRRAVQQIAIALIAGHGRTFVHARRILTNTNESAGNPSKARDPRCCRWTACAERYFLVAMWQPLIANLAVTAAILVAWCSAGDFVARLSRGRQQLLFGGSNDGRHGRLNDDGVTPAGFGCGSGQLPSRLWLISHLSDHLRCVSAPLVLTYQALLVFLGNRIDAVEVPHSVLHW